MTNFFVHLTTKTIEPYHLLNDFKIKNFFLQISVIFERGNIIKFAKKF